MMRPLTKKIILAGFVVFALAGSGFFSDARADLASDQKEYPFLYPGFQFAIESVADGGLSLYALYDGEGFIVCSSAVNPSNEVVTALGHCNARVTAPGFHISPDALFGRKGIAAKFRTFMKMMLIALPQAAEVDTAMPAMSDTAQAVTNISQQSIAPNALEQYQLSNTMARLKIYSRKADQNCDSTPPFVPAPFFMSDLNKDIQDRIRDFEKECSKFSSAIDIDDPKIVGNPEALFCRQQNENLDYAGQVMKACNIVDISAQAGEPGNSELWFPGQPVSASCLTTLKQMGPKKNGVPVLDANGFNIQPDGLPLILWLQKQQEKIQGIAPTSSEEAIAEHVTECLKRNPVAEATMQARLKKAVAGLATLITTPDPAAPSANAPSTVNPQ